MELDPVIRARAERMLGARIVGWTPRSHGLTHSVAGVARLAGGSTVFLKAATEASSAELVASELAALRHIEGSFMPELLAYDEADRPLMALEDLSHGHWPEPYPPDLTLLDAVLGELRTTPVPDELGLEVVGAIDAGKWAGLADAAADGTPPLASWIAAHEAAILDLARSIGGGESLVHGDLWYSNICFLTDRVVFVDWSHAYVGSPWHDAATVSIDLVIEGRPPIPSREGAAWAAAYLAGTVGVLATGPPASIADPARWRTDVEELVDGAAWWVAQELGLAAPPRLSQRNVGW